MHLKENPAQHRSVHLKKAAGQKSVRFVVGMICESSSFACLLVVKALFLSYTSVFLALLCWRSPCPNPAILDRVFNTTCE
jgi:hypothetical protein